MNQEHRLSSEIRTHDAFFEPTRFSLDDVMRLAPENSFVVQSLTEEGQKVDNAFVLAIKEKPGSTFRREKVSIDVQRSLIQAAGQFYFSVLDLITDLSKKPLLIASKLLLVRALNHPLFQNISREETVKKLQHGMIILRPSSKSNHLAISLKVNEVISHHLLKCDMSKYTIVNDLGFKSIINGHWFEGSLDEVIDGLRACVIDVKNPLVLAASKHPLYRDFGGIWSSEAAEEYGARCCKEAVKLLSVSNPILIRPSSKKGLVTVSCFCIPTISIIHFTIVFQDGFFILTQGPNKSLLNFKTIDDLVDFLKIHYVNSN